MAKGIFKDLIKEHKDKFNLTMMFGISIAELDADSLRASICVLGEDQKREREDRKRERDMMKLFSRR